MGTRQSSLSKVEPESPMEQVKPNASGILLRAHPQETFSETAIHPDSFFGRIRSIFADTVLQTQLDQLRHQGSYDAFSLKWNPKWDIRRLHGAKCPIQGSPPTLYWDSDVGKWIEAACYFLASQDGPESARAKEFIDAIDALVTMMAKAQQPDGYLGTYFTMVDPKGKLRNLRDMHEMYCCGHLLEAALAHHHYTGSDTFLNIMIRYVDLLSYKFGPGKHQLHGYPGHPELELAVLRLYSRTKNPKHYAFGKYLLEARGVREPDLGGDPFFVWEAKQRNDEYFHRTMNRIGDGRYHQWHAPLHDQDAILGHSVRAMYLITAAANMDGALLDDAKRLWIDAVDNKMYPTGGFGSDPSIEGFSEIPHFLPNGADEGGCYAETCAGIGGVMVSERLLSHQLDGKVRDVMERSLMNTVMGGASLDGKTFFYDNILATSRDQTADRSKWFDVCCCPPNLCRTVGLLGGYAWSVKPIEAKEKTIRLDVYLHLSATRKINLPDGANATVIMSSEMPWRGKTTLKMDAPAGWKWQVNLPRPDYASDFTVSMKVSETIPGFVNLETESCEVSIDFEMPVKLLAPHPATHQDTITVSRGPIIYTAETYDNGELESSSPHFAQVGILESAQFSEIPMDIGGFPVVALQTDLVYVESSRGQEDIGSTRVINGTARTWEKARHGLTLIPFFSRCNRQKGERIRTSFLRVGRQEVVVA